MQSPIRRWPEAHAYFPALARPAQSIRDNRLHRLSVEPHPALGGRVPFGRNGRFGSVFKFTGNGKTFALKVFVRNAPRRQARYRLIGEHLAQVKPRTPRLISFKYHERGIRVRGDWYPALVMDWSSGVPLDQYLTEWVKSQQGDNAQLCSEWVRTVQDLRSHKIAHGDLQHENILVKANGAFQLIDYDGMFVPKMRDENLYAAEVGRPAYQHPARSARPYSTDYFDERLDDFSALVILLSLAAVDDGLWTAYHDDDDKLIISEQDLRKPSESPLLAALAERPGPVATLTRLLVQAATGAIGAVPSFGEVVDNPDVQALLNKGTYQRTPARQPARGALPPGLLPGRANETTSPARQKVVSRSHAPGTPAGRVPPKVPKAATPELTSREVDVARLLAKSLGVKEIADQLTLERDTVTRHLRTLRTKTGSGSMEALTVWAKAQYPAPPEPQAAKQPSPRPKPRPKPRPTTPPGGAPTEAATARPTSPPPREEPATPPSPWQPLRPRSAEPLPDLAELFREQPQGAPRPSTSELLDQLFSRTRAGQGEVARLTADGEEHLRTGNSQEALQAFDQALAGNPFDVRALIGRAEALRLMRRFREAFRDLNQALRVQPGNARALQVRSETNRDAGRKVRAWRDQRRARRRGVRNT